MADVDACRRTGAGISTKTPDVSVVMPCLDEEDTVATCVQQALRWFERAGLSGEVIVVDNGSRDSSAQRARAAGARVVSEPTRGKGRACTRGFEEARGEFIMLSDSDGTYDLSNLDPLLSELREGSDMVIGNRFLGRMEPGAMSWSHRTVGNPLLTLTTRLASGARVGDTLSGLRGFSRSSLDVMRLGAGDFEIEAEMILKAHQHGLKVTEVPIDYGRRHAPSKLRTFRDGWRILRFVLVHAPHFLYTIPGLVLIAAGVLATIYPFVFPSGLTVGSLHWQPVFSATILLAVGVNAILFGFAGRMYLDSRRIARRDRWVETYRRYLGLERMLSLAALLLAAGGGVDLYLLVVWIAGAAPEDPERIAGLAQSLIVVGANLGLGAFVLELIRPRD